MVAFPPSAAILEGTKMADKKKSLKKRAAAWLWRNPIAALIIVAGVIAFGAILRHAIEALLIGAALIAIAAYFVQLLFKASTGGFNKKGS
jgi:hypothetical protein